MQKLILQTNYHNISYQYSRGLEKNKVGIKQIKNKFPIKDSPYKNLKVIHNKKNNEAQYKNMKVERFNLSKIPFLIVEDKLDICVISYGGTGSNNLVNLLRDNGINSRTKNWEEYICHCPEYFYSKVPVLYIYSDPRLALTSMYKRGKDIYEVNQIKLSNNKKVNFSEENLLKLMINQFKNWYKHKNEPNIYFIKSERLYTNEFYIFIKSLLNVETELSGFPLAYKVPFNTLETIPIEYNDLFKKYKNDIDWIINL